MTAILCPRCKEPPTGRMRPNRSGDTACNKCRKAAFEATKVTAPLVDVQPGDPVTWHRPRAASDGHRVGNDTVPIDCKVVSVGVKVLRLRRCDTGTDHDVPRRCISLGKSGVHRLSDEHVALVIADALATTNKAAAAKWQLGESTVSGWVRGRSRKQQGAA